jgi:hypothetical protein
MIFLIDYDREHGRLCVQEFPDSERAIVQQRQAILERDALAAGNDREIVILEARTRAEIETTHARYFKTLRELSAPSVVAG